MKNKYCKTFSDQKCLTISRCNNNSCSIQKALVKSFESSPIGEAFVSREGKFLFANQSFADILGYSISEMKNLTYKEVTHHKDFSKDYLQAVSVAKGETKTYDMKKRYIKKNGDIIWVHLYVNGLFNENNEFQYYIVYAIDIDDLKEQENLVNFAAESGEVGIWTWDPENDELTWNKEMYKIYGLEEGVEINYKTWENFIHKEDKVNVKKSFKKTIEKGSKFNIYFRIIVNGKIKYIRAKAENYGQKPNSILTGSNIDVTDFREMKKEIDKNHEELEYFTYSVSHDLKSPLVTLCGFSSIISHELNNEVVDWNLIKDSANEIAKATQSLASTIDSILHLSRVGRIYIENNIINTKDLIDEILMLNCNKIKSKKVKIINNSNINIFVQKEIFSSILQNMIINSIEHAIIDNEILKITIDFKETKNGFYFLFTDNGKGMSEEQLKNLFNYSNRQYAKGFGMMIIKKGIDFHGGKLEIKSKLGNGTSFKVSFTHNDK